MPDTYETAPDAEADRVQQKELLAALGAWDRALRRDECGAWRISGKHGSIHTWGNGNGSAMFVACSSARQWTFAKRRLGFCLVTQDGDDEGVLRLHELPTPEQAAVIRDVLGIRKRVKLGAETLERLRARAAAWNVAQSLTNDSIEAPGRANATAALSEPV